MDPLDLGTRILALLVPILDRLSHRRERKKRPGVRLEVDLPENMMWESQTDLRFSLRISGSTSRQLQSGLELLRAGKFADALAQFERAETGGAKDFRLLNLKSITLYRLQRYQEALDASKAAARLKPEDPDVQVNLANALRKLGHERNAIGRYRKTIATSSANIAAVFNLADAHREGGHPTVALTYYDKALKLDPSRSDVWNNRAIALIDLGQYARAEESLRRALQNWPNHVHALSNLSKLLAGLRRYDESIRLAERALKLSPDDITAWHSKAFSLSKKRSFAEAAQAYREVLKRNSSDAGALGELGSLEVMLGDHPNAEAHLTAALAGGFDRARGYVDLGSLRFRQGRFPEGMRLSVRALITRPPRWIRSVAYSNMAFVFFTYRKYLQGEASARRALLFNAENAAAWNSLAGCLYELGDEQGSRDAIDRAIALEPDNPVFIKNRGELMKKRQPQERQ